MNAVAQADRYDRSQCPHCFANDFWTDTQTGKQFCESCDHQSSAWDFASAASKTPCTAGLVFISTSDTHAAERAVLEGHADHIERRDVRRRVVMLIAEQIASQQKGKCSPQICVAHRTDGDCCVQAHFPALYAECEVLAHE